MSEIPAPGWEEHEAEQRGAWLRLTAAQRLAWLEEAKRFAELAARARKRPAADENAGAT